MKLIIKLSDYPEIEFDVSSKHYCITDNNNIIVFNNTIGINMFKLDYFYFEEEHGEGNMENPEGNMENPYYQEP